MQMSQQVSDSLLELCIPISPFLYSRGNLTDLSTGPPAPPWQGARAHIVPLTQLSAADSPQHLCPPSPSQQAAGVGKQPGWPEQAHSHVLGSEAAPQDGWLQLSPCPPLQHQHHLAPSSSFPSSPRRFYGCGRALWPLQGSRQEPSAPLLMRNPYPAAAGAPTLPPRPPLGRSAAPAWRGNPPPRPHLPQGLEPARSPCVPAAARGFLGCGVPEHHVFLPASRRAFLLCPLALRPQPSTLCPITSASPQPLPQPPVLPAKFLSGQSLRPLGLDASGVLAGLGFLFLSRPSPRHAPGPLLAFAQRCGIGSSLGTRGLPAEPTSRFGCPASLTLPRGAASHTHPVPSRSHHPSGFLREDDLQRRLAQGACRG